jgi:hypothetical protein
MESYIEYAALKSGLNVQIAHGLEPGHARHRPGSPSYDLDLLDPQTGRRLSANNPGDRERIGKFIEESAAGGATGIGAGYVYMGGHRFHVGGGNPAVWGDNLRRSGAPQWVIDAYERGRARVITEQQRTAELQQLRQAQRIQVAGPVPTRAPTITTPVTTTSPAGTLTETATGSTWTAAREAESDRERDNRRSLALSHMPGWRGLRSDPETEWQMRGGAFGARARAGRGVFRTPDSDVDKGRNEMDQAAARQFFHHKVRGTGKIDVTVKSKGQESTAQSGPFKKIPWHRHQQMTPAEHGPSEQKEMTGGEGPGAGPG